MAGAQLASIATGSPRLGACVNCGRHFERYRQVTFRDGAATLSLNGTADPEMFVSQVADYLRGVANQAVEASEAIFKLLAQTQQAEVGPRIVAAVTALRGVPALHWPSRRELTACAVIRGDDSLFIPLVQTTAVNIAVDAMKLGADTPVVLDSAVPPWLFDNSMRGQLAPLAPFEIPAVWTATLDLVASWGADRAGDRLPPEQRVRFTRGAVAWTDGHPDSANGLGSADFLQRTIDVDTVERAIIGIALESPADAQRVADLWIGWHVIEGADFYRRWADLIPPELRAERGRRYRNDYSLEDTASLLVLLSQLELYSDVAEVFRERLTRLPLAAAARAAVVAIELFEQAGDLDTAYSLLSDLVAAHPRAGWARLPATDQLELCNVIGNVAHQVGGPEAALDEYTRLIPLLHAEAVTTGHRWTVISNAANCLSETGEIRSAYKLLSHLIASEPLSTWELSRSLVDLGKYAQQLGMYEQARDLVERAWEGMRFESAQSSRRYEALMGMAAAAGALGDSTAQLNYAQLAAAQARTDQRPDRELHSAVQAAFAAGALGDQQLDELVAQVAEFAETLDRQIAAAAETHPRWAEVLRGQTFWARVNLAALRHDTEAVSTALSNIPSPSPAALTTLAKLLLDDRQFERAGAVIEQAWLGEMAAAFRDPNIDVQDIDAFRGTRLLRNLTAQHALELHRRSPSDAGWLLRASELDGSLLASYLSWPDDARPSTADLLNPIALSTGPELRGAGLLFVVYEEREAHIIHRNGDRETILFHMAGDDLEAVRAEVAAVTKRGRADGDPLAECPRWQQFAARLGACLVEHATSDERLIFLFGTALDGLPLHVVPLAEQVLIRTMPCSYAASLTQLAGLIRRRQRTPGPIASACIVSVARRVESPLTAAAFSDGASRWHETLSGVMPTVALIGVEATPDAVRDHLGSADLLVLSCHGIADPGRRTHALLLAAHGQEPPSLLRATRASSVGADFLLTWDSFIPPYPRNVVSAACSSASSTLTVSGERISIDRTLLTGGTTAFVGPLWDVSVSDAHLFIDVALRCRFQAKVGRGWESAWQETVSKLHESMAPATWQAFVLIGDWI